MSRPPNHGVLPSGRRWRLARRRALGAPLAYVLSVDHGGAPPDAADTAALLGRALEHARALGERHFGDPACYTVVLSGARTRRRPWLHAHIVPAPNPAAKHRAMLALTVDRILRGRAPRVHRLLAWAAGLERKEATGALPG